VTPKEKARLLFDCAHKRGCDTVVETGTGDGFTIEHALPWAKHIYSIEINRDRYNLAKEKFRGDKNVRLSCGNSEDILQNILVFVLGKPIFWLDAHEPNTRAKPPIIRELAVIRRFDQHAPVLVDDASLFGQENWPSLEELENEMGTKSRTTGDVIRFNV
jgi:hypothetical protein